ncbi:ABC transporter ATP-binding protein [Histidinibacterium aquaticum]|uniref:Nickel import system ATP-binding protein NikD n=1 Tax=Histidinibacterium aquaticum TaxID=2613962 RepID=A0A5J5GMH4_9RHOB|nr:ABC transporter ATP-binding protein [Histidinibacterium aquaticum]KAA9009395.1 ABC transporter ATP-binding protein [Histidinibacterium aquaticum]
MNAMNTVTPAPRIAEVKGLKVHFQSKQGRVHAVDGVDFDIRDGEMLGLVGETGCGKSVTGRCFLDLVPQPPADIAGGRVLFRPRGGKACPDCSGKGCETCGGTGAETLDLLNIPAKKMRQIRGEKIAMIFQDPGKALNPTLTIGAQLSEVFLQHKSHELLEAAGVGEGDRGWVAGSLRRQANQREGSFDRWARRFPPLKGPSRRLQKALDEKVAAALAETQIPNPRRVMTSYPHELSGGMRQRVMIAQSLACDPDLIIADEPTTALDVTIQARILDLIKMLQAKRRTSVLYISHDLSLVRKVCDRVAVMYAGRIAEVGTVSQVFTDPRHPYTQGLLNAVPRAGTRRGHLASIPGTVPELVDPPPACRFVDRCPKAMAQCRGADPQLLPVTEGHDVACFLEHPREDTAPETPRLETA